jgi:integrase
MILRCWRCQALGKRPSIIRAAITRLDQKMAIGESRFAAKVAAREEDPSLWSFSTGKIHSHVTRADYQQHILAFVNWVRERHTIRTLEQLDARASALTAEYLAERLTSNYSPYTLQAVRSALRLFFGERDLADEVKLPHREREGITRSRGSAKRDADFQPANWQPLIQFLQGTGLRRMEITALQARDVRVNDDGRAEVYIHAGKGGRPRTVIARQGFTAAVLVVIQGHQPDEHVFPRIPSHLDIHALRREFAQGLYQEVSGRPLPPATGRLRRSDYDLAAVEIVSKQLGHNRVDVVLRHYLR